MAKIRKDSNEAIYNALWNPFEPSKIKWTNKGGKSPNDLAYVDARIVMKRLDDVLGMEGWSDTYTYVDGQGVFCQLSIRLSDGTWVTKSDGASLTKIEPVKGAVSDSFKRAAAKFGIGRYLYYLDPRKFNRSNVSSWPSWALPDNNLENWEDIAEMEAEADMGIDNYDAEVVPEGYELVYACTTQEELDKLVKSLGEEQAIALGNDINAKRRELYHASKLQADTDKSSPA